MKYYLWGIGKICKNYMENLYQKIKDYVKIGGFIDNNSRKKKYYGFTVYTPYEVDLDDNDKIVIITTKYAEEIKNQIIKEKLFPIEKVFFLDSFYSDILSLLKKHKKVVRFIGDYDTFLRAKYRANIMLYSSDYIEEYNDIDDEALFFLCPPIFEKDERKIRIYEEALSFELIQMGIDLNRVFQASLWMDLLFSNILLSFGEKNPDITFFVIATNEPLVGMANLMWLVMTNVEYANLNGMIPIVDFKNFDNQYATDAEENSWEKFFYPVSDYTLDEVYMSKNVIICSGLPNPCIDSKPEKIKLRKEIKEEIEKYKTQVFPQKEKVLGVIYRATDYNNNTMGHPLPYDLDDFIAMIKMESVRIGYRYIFLATEVEEAVEIFRKEFGEYVICTNQLRYKANETRWLGSIKFDRDNDDYLRGKEYLEVIYLLSQCDSLISQRNGAQFIAKILNKGKYEYVIDL